MSEYIATMTIREDKRAEWDTHIATARKESLYGDRCFTYADAWATLMEKAIARGETVEACAKATSHEADTDGITSNMYGIAVRLLAFCWVHGEALRRWHNLDLQIGTEGVKANAGGGVLNPAVIQIGGS